MESIKQEIINNIYENGEQLITGPILQTVLLDMVDDVNNKVASASGDLVEKSGSWDDAADWVEQNSSSVVLQSDLDGYATEQWVEDQGYLKEVPEGYATTESLNDLSESVAEAIADIPVVDLSGYATTESVNEATESVKEWVEAKHYLTTASLSGSVTEETVGFMINDATASVKEWVESQSYATETFVSESIASIDIPSTDGFVTTASYNADSASFDERINAITGSDLSGYATTESLNSLSESVAGDIADLSESIASITGSAPIDYVTTSSFNALSESVAALSESVDGYDIEQIWSAVNAAEDAGVIEWNDEDNEFVGIPVATAEDLALLSESVAQDFEDLANSDADGNPIAGFLENAGLATKSEIPGVGGYEYTLTPVADLSESVASDIEELSASIAAITGSTPQDLSGYLTTASYQVDSASFDQRINAISGSDLSSYATTASLNSLSESVANDFANLNIPDVSGLATTQSVNNLSESVSNTFNQYATTQSITNLSQSISQSISQITGSDVDLSGYATTASLNSLSESLKGYVDEAVDGVNSKIDSEIDSANPDSAIYGNLQPLMQWVEDPSDPEYGMWTPVDFTTTASFESASASFDQRINSISQSAGGADTDLRNFLFGADDQAVTGITGSVTNIYSSVSSSSALGFNAVPDDGRSVGIIIHNTGASSSTITFPDTITVGGATYNLITNGVDNSGSMSIPAGEYGDIVITRKGNDLFVRTSVDVSSISGSMPDLSQYATTASVSSSILSTLEDLGIIFDNEGQLLYGFQAGGEGDFGETAPYLYRQLAEAGVFYVWQEYDEETGDPTTWYVDNGLGLAENRDHPVMTLLEYVGMPVSWSEADGYWTSSYQDTSASFDERINNIITGSGVDLSGYATTASLNSVSESLSQSIAAIPGADLSGYATTQSVNDLSSSVGSISSSFADTIANLPTGSSGGDYLPLAGGTLTGDLKVNASVGVGTNAQGANSLAVGTSNTSTANAHYSLAVGENVQASVYGGTAVGRETRVEGNGAFGMASGFRNRVTAMAGYAGGCRSTASGQFATAIGFGVEATTKGQVVLGAFNELDPVNNGEKTGSYAVIFGIGKSSTWNQDNVGDVTRENGLAIKWNGDIDIKYSGSTVSLQDKIAQLEAGGGGGGADLSGYLTTASYQIDSASFSERINSITGSSSSDSIWIRGAGSGSALISGSPILQAGGAYSLAHGIENSAAGENSHAEGMHTHADGVGSHAEGSNTKAEGRGSHAEGYNTYASGNYAHAEGYQTLTKNEAEHAEGKYNVTASKQIFSIGVGTSSNRRNVISIVTGSDGSGSVYIQGIGNYDGISPYSNGVSDLATVINSLTASSTPVDLSGYATTESLNALSNSLGQYATTQSVNQLGTTISTLSASFDHRIDEIVAVSGAIDPTKFAGAPSIIYTTDGTYGLVGVNISSGSATTTYWTISNQEWQLENLNLSDFDRIECYFKHSPKVVVLPLDAGTENSDGYYVEKASTLSTDLETSTQGNVDLSYFSRKWVVVDSTKTKLQVAVNSDTGDYLYKIVGYPKLV